MVDISETYNFDSAFHYKAYRPPLHNAILDRCLNNQKFKTALDVGCGVGNSSVALTRFCDLVVGFDPSESMIQQAQSHQKVRYSSQLKDLTSNYDLLVFFGSLFYVEEESIGFFVDNLSPQGFALCCDFEIIFDTVLDDLGIRVGNIAYDHAKNLNAYDLRQIKHVNSERFETDFECQNKELAHLVVSEANIKNELSKKFDSKNLYNSLMEEFELLYPSNTIKLKAKMYYSYYRKSSL